MPGDSKQNSQKPYQVCEADLLATLLTVTSAHEQHESINHDFFFCLIYLFLPWFMTGYSIGVDRHSVNFGVTLAVNHDILVIKKIKGSWYFFLTSAWARAQSGSLWSTSVIHSGQSWK